jgi:hypothetical protein
MQIPEEALRQWRLSDADRAALADLPEAVEPFFRADPQDDGEPAMRGGYYRIANDQGLDIGVGPQGVYAVDPRNELPDCFVNSSVADLAEFLRETGAFQAVAGGLDEDDAVDRVVRIRDRLRRRDPAAFADDAWWSMVFDQLESGQV